MRTLNMKSKWLKHLCLWKVRWLFLLGVGVSLIAISIFFAITCFWVLNSDGKAGITIGVSCGMVGFYGLDIILELFSYAYRRIKLGKKVKEYNKTKTR